MQVGLKAASGDKEARPGSEQPDERAELRRALDLGELPDLAVDQVLHVRVEETAAAAWVGSRHGLGQAAAHDPLRVVSTGNCRLVAYFWAEPEHRVDEAVGCAVNLSLRERPQFDGLHATGQRVRQVAESEQP